MTTQHSKETANPSSDASNHSNDQLSQQQAVALSYRQHDLPRVVAKGKGYVAQQIVQTAQAAGVPLHQDHKLTQALSALEIKQAIPRALFSAVAQVLIFAFEVKRQKENEASISSSNTADESRLTE